MRSYYRNLSVFLLTVILAVSSCFVSYGQPTGQYFLTPDGIKFEAASASNALTSDSGLLSGVAPRSSVGSVTNTLTAPTLPVAVEIYDSSTGKYKRTVSGVARLVNGRYDLSFLDAAKDGESITSFYFYLQGRMTKTLPSPPGNYRLSVDFTSDIHIPSYSAAWLATRYKYQNSIVQRVNTDFDEFRFNAGDFYGVINSVAVRSDYDEAFVLVSFPSNSGLRNFAGSFSVNFTPVSEPGASTAGPTVSTGDYQAGVSDSLGNISSGIADMGASLDSAADSLEYISESQNLIIKGIDNIILHISDQLYAFWDQLFNLIHLPTLAKMNEILEAIKNLDLSVDLDLDELKKTIKDCTKEKIANDNKISEEIRNGYDNSGINADKDRLKDSLKEYDSAEKNVLDSVNDALSDFDFDSDLSEFSSAIRVVSDFIQQLYDASGGFKVVINFSLLLSVASIVIGFYRFREGG